MKTIKNTRLHKSMVALVVATMPMCGFSAAPTTIQGSNEQNITVEAPIVNLGASTSNVRVEVSVGSVHEGSTLQNNKQSIYVGGDEGDNSPGILNLGVTSGGDSVCANTMIGSVGSSSCLD